MQHQEEFLHQIADAYEHLYDVAALRMHPLLWLTPPNDDARARAWALHKLLIKAIEDIAPSRDAPPSSREWRRHRLMQLRYVDVQSVQTTAADLSVSRRQFYRIHDDAVAAVAGLLVPELAAPHEDPTHTRSAILRSEAARVPQPTFAVPSELARRAAELLAAVCSEHHVRLHFEDLAASPALAVDPALFRQLLLGLLDYFIERSTHAEIVLSTQQTAHDASSVQLLIMLDAAAPIDVEPLSALHELAIACGVHLNRVLAAHRLRGFVIDAPICDSCRTVLAVDDNADMLQIYERCLTPHGFRVVTAQDSASALASLDHVRPEAVFLDIMLPGRDGWEVLQQMLHRPGSAPARIFVCSVLRQRELALALGASGYLQKPFTTADLLHALADAA